jgi:hypothetical protein
MILRRVIKHFRNQEWTAIFLDFLIVVVGVFVGLQVQQWNEARIDRRDEDIFLDELHDDINRMEALIGRTESMRLGGWRDFETSGDIVFGLSDKRALTGQECRAIAFSHIKYVGRTELPSMIGLRDSGRTGIIRDRPLAKALAAFQQRREAFDIVARETYSANIIEKYPEFFKAMTIRTPELNNPEALERAVSMECRLEELQESQALLNDIASNLDAMDAFMRDGMMPYTEQIRTVHKALDRILDHTHEGADP